MTSTTGKIPFPLYHGTSTLFLDDIVEYGLGGKNPILDWGVLEFAQELLPYVEANLGDDQQWMPKIQSFGRMVRQETGHWNFQHGDTYLTPSQDTALRYATNTRCGSELLSYAVDLLQELAQRNVSGIRDRLYHQFPFMFRFLDINPAPLLIAVDGLPYEALASAENGGDVSESLDLVLTMWQEQPDLFGVFSQQSNFRLGVPQPKQNLRISIVNVSQWRPQGPICTLYPLVVP